MEPSCYGDHSGIVGCELEFRKERGPSPLPAFLHDTGTKSTVRRHSSTDGYLLDSSIFGSLYQFIHQYVYQCFLETCTYVGLVLFHELGVDGHLIADKIKKRCLYAAETVVISRDMRL